MAIFRNLCIRLIPPEAGLKILQCILAVKIFAFLDLAKNLSFSDSLLVLQENATWTLKKSLGGKES